MLELLQKIFIGHSHKYDTIESANVLGESGKYISSKTFICRCNICGKIKQYKINY